MKKIVIAAGTGFLGSVLTEYFKNKVETITILTRGKPKTKDNIKFVHWDAKTLGNWKTEMNNADLLINMTGKSVDCRYTKKNKKLIMSSRIASTLILGKAIKECENPPKTWLNSSTGTIYRHSLDKEMNEINGEIGTGFSVDVARTWEKTFFEQHTPNTRKVALRTSIVLGRHDGALPPIINLTKMGFGGKQGSGNQKLSWIHEIDFARSLEFIVHNTKITDPINIVSPKPTINLKFMKTLRKTLHVPIGIPLSRPILELGARLIKTETELILKSRNVVPEELQNKGFTFLYPDLENAFKHLIYYK